MSHEQRSARAGAFAPVAVLLALCSGCYARAQTTYPQSEYGYVDRYPHRTHDGRHVYLIDGRWSYRDRGRWVYTREQSAFHGDRRSQHAPRASRAPLPYRRAHPGVRQNAPGYAIPSRSAPATHTPMRRAR